PRSPLSKYLLLPNLLLDGPRSWLFVQSARSGRCSSRHKIHFQKHLHPPLLRKFMIPRRNLRPSTSASEPSPTQNRN
ncbi:hypothetical protein ACLOJK_034278, partial [Asimina triloba]